MKKNILFLSISAIALFNSCSKGSGGSTTTDPCSTSSFKFSTDVQPIINASCGPCHGPGSTNSGGPLTDYNKIFSKRAEIKFQVETSQMPKSGSLTAAQKNTIICWINSGAPNN